MSKGIDGLHSHSLLERELKFPKHLVLIDAKYKSMFADGTIKITPYKQDNTEYYIVPTLAFVKRGGIFKALMK